MHHTQGGREREREGMHHTQGGGEREREGMNERVSEGRRDEGSGDNYLLLQVSQYSAGCCYDNIRPL